MKKIKLLAIAFCFWFGNSFCQTSAIPDSSLSLNKVNNLTGKPKSLVSNIVDNPEESLNLVKVAPLPLLFKLVIGYQRSFNKNKALGLEFEYLYNDPGKIFVYGSFTKSLRFEPYYRYYLSEKGSEGNYFQFGFIYGLYTSKLTFGNGYSQNRLSEDLRNPNKELGIG